MNTTIKGNPREKGVKSAFLAVAVFCAVSAAMAAETWPAADLYVDASASAEGADGSVDHPYPAIQQAVSKAKANETIYVAEGVYATGETPVKDVNYTRV